MSETLPKEAQVPLVVLDRFIKLSQENTASYATIVAALDQMSIRTMTMADILDQLNQQITEEQLARTITNSIGELRCDLQKVHDTIKGLGAPEYNLATVVAANLEFHKTTETEVQAYAKSLLWVLGVLGVFQRNKTLFAFVAGAAVVNILGSAGMTVWDMIKFLGERM